MPTTAPMVEENQSTYRVTLSDGGAATVKIQGDEIVIDLGLYKESHTLISLTNNARSGKLPSWVKQIPNVQAAIDARFADEAKRGIDSFERLGFSDGEIRTTDLRTGISVTGKVVEIKRQFAATGVLPRAFSSKKARMLMGLPVEGKSHE